MRGSLARVPPSDAGCCPKRVRQRETLGKNPTALLLCRGLCFRTCKGILDKVQRKGLRQYQTWTQPLTVRSERSVSALLLSVKDNQEQSGQWCLVGRYINSVRLPSRCSLVWVTTQAFPFAKTRIQVTFSENSLKAVCALRCRCRLLLSWSSSAVFACGRVLQPCARPRHARPVASLPPLLPCWCAGSRRRVLHLVRYGIASDSTDMGSLDPGTVFFWFICYKYV